MGVLFIFQVPNPLSWQLLIMIINGKVKMMPIQYYRERMIQQAVQLQPNKGEQAAQDRPVAKQAAWNPFLSLSFLIGAILPMICNKII